MKTNALSIHIFFYNFCILQQIIHDSYFKDYYQFKTI